MNKEEEKMEIIKEIIGLAGEAMIKKLKKKRGSGAAQMTITAVKPGKNDSKKLRELLGG